jgi:hypothetical protein
MYQLYFVDKDTTIYERFPNRNTGIDAILELTKIASGSKLNGEIQADTYNSRILVDFSSQISTLITAISNGTIPPIGKNPGSSSVYLNLRATDSTDLPISYTLQAFPVSQSWVNGNGNYSDLPEIRNGASWYYRDDYDTATAWNTSSAASSGNPGATIVYGGGTWITGSGYEASQSFSFQSPDIRMDVTDIVSKWTTGVIPNYGFIVKRPWVDEISGDILGSLKFFSRETNTIFVPKLEVAWNDTNLAGTGSVTEISSSELYVPYFKNLRESYRDNDITLFRVGVRPEYPTTNYSMTNSHYLNNFRLPATSYYSIKDTVTDETIIPFNNDATQISCDANGNYFKIAFSTFMPERFYKIVLKAVHSAGDIQIHDNGYYFKVVR